ncbi:protein adenylyltransferase SelO [Piscirickettsia salmonis]|uniref:protein adenylyltransferase SelO n=1 Tax=Piscirickettsia salmonis TaxID=1238 RepID=UPI003750C8C5
MKILSSSFRQLGQCFYHQEKINPLKNIQLQHSNRRLAKSFGIESEALSMATPYFNGEKTWMGVDYLSMVYSGHQFGRYVPRLGDGRAILLGEIQDQQRQRWQVQIKGAGQTQYSRQGDGRAVLRSSVREYLASEALYALGIPTTRALALMSSDDVVQRERPETAALLVRLTPCLVRFGSFEYFFYTEQYDCLKQLTDYVIKQHYAECLYEESPYGAFLLKVVKRTAKLIALWQVYGFNHGVMNTDNMSIIGETFDYGPYAFLDDYIPGFICNHSDHYGRYAFNQQADIGLWNLNALAHALSPLIDHKDIVYALKYYEKKFAEVYFSQLAQRFGIISINRSTQELMLAGLSILETLKLDYHQFFRKLSHAVYQYQGCFNITALMGEDYGSDDKVKIWLDAYEKIITQQEGSESMREIGQQMLSVNPKYILRSYLLTQAIEWAEQGDFSEVDHLMHCLTHPCDEQPEFERYAAAVPDWGKKIILSCSS